MFCRSNFCYVPYFVFFLFYHLSLNLIITYIIFTRTLEPLKMSHLLTISISVALTLLCMAKPFRQTRKSYIILVMLFRSLIIIQYIMYLTNNAYLYPTFLFLDYCGDQFLLFRLKLCSNPILLSYHKFF